MIHTDPVLLCPCKAQWLTTKPHHVPEITAVAPKGLRLHIFHEGTTVPIANFSISSPLQKGAVAGK